MTVTKTLVDERKRTEFLPKHFGAMFSICETFVYDFMTKYVENYDGGMWDYYELSNGGFFMAPSEEKNWKISIPSNFFEATVDSETMGIIVTLYAINFAMWRYKNQTWVRVLIEKDEKLKDFVSTLKSSVKIYSAID